jgi:hypothetical protein
MARANCSGESGFKWATAKLFGSTSRPPAPCSAIRLTQRQLAQQRTDVVLARRQLIGQERQQLGVRRRIEGVLQVERMHQTAAQEHRPQAIGGIAAERHAVRRRQQRRAGRDG